MVNPTTRHPGSQTLELAEVLFRRVDGAGYRLTETRRMVLHLIAAYRGRFTSADLLALAQQAAPGIGQATIFRTLELLGELGILQRIHHEGDHCHSYVVCASQQHHHLVCSACGRVFEFEPVELESQLRRLCDRLGFQLDSHHLEVHGRCQRCHT